ncbi:3-oxoacyl-[acyl-carrier protein] reductase [Pseudonocardia sp. N23]|nr:3-oxoacyl-[acyl-carrier protein] reductase [Pseudonocardia sp. N23]
MTLRAMTGLLGKVALVSGAGRGQGRSHALRLAQEGADVILIDICADISTIGYPMATEDELRETARMVRRLDRRAVIGVADVRKPEEVAAAVDRGLAELGHVDIVVANAGVLSYGFAWELSEQAWDDTVNTNLKGVWSLAKAAIPAMIERGAGGSIVITSSSAGLRGAPLMAHYVAAKHGLVGLARALAIELGEHGIRVNTVHPMGVDSSMSRDPQVAELFAKYPQLFGPLGESLLPKQGSLQPEEVSEIVAFLASDAARNVTGIQFPVDRGQTART